MPEFNRQQSNPVSDRFVAFKLTQHCCNNDGQHGCKWMTLPLGRAAIFEQHRQYSLEMYYFLTTDPAGAFEYLKTQAISRLYLDNVPNLQSSWVTQGEKVGQMALKFGANDMGRLMIEENVVSEAGTVHHLSLDAIHCCITNVGYIL